MLRYWSGTAPHSCTSHTAHRGEDGLTLAVFKEGQTMSSLNKPCFENPKTKEEVDIKESFCIVLMTKAAVLQINNLEKLKELA